MQSREFARNYRRSQKARALELEARLAALRDENRKLISFLRDNFESGIANGNIARPIVEKDSSAGIEGDFCDPCLARLIFETFDSSKDVEDGCSQ